MKTTLTALFSLCVFAVAANAAPIIPVAATSSTAGTDFRSVDNLINGSGLDANDPPNHLLAGDGFNQSWVTTDPGGFPSDYFDSVTINPVLTFDLGADTPIDQILVWQYGGSTGGTNFSGNAVKDFTLRFATDADGPTGFGTSIPSTLNLATSPPPPGTDTGPSAIPREDIDFGQTITARFVEMEITDNYFGETGASGGDRVGLGEVQFNVIPEPASLLLVGVGGLLMLRRR